MQALKRLTLLACAVAALLAPATANATITTKTIDYGPFTIPAGSGDPMDHMGAGMIENQIVQNVAKPCTGCTIIGVTPDLVYSNGSEANIATGPMLHHTVFAAQSSGKSDVTCGNSGPGLLGERFFASGNERTAVDLESLPYGYKVNKSETWNMIVDLMNWETTSKTVYVRMTYKYATGTDAESRSPLRPVWLDQDGCSLDSLITVPVGESDTHYDWKATIGGKLIAAAGHIHDYGVREELTNQSTGGTLLCNSVAGYGGTGYVTPDGMEHISSMSVCTGNPIATISKGQTLRLHTIYDNTMTMPIEDAMGIMIAYLG
jgi:stress up-regulated protein Nod 19